jgi:1,4-dihydroxy-2-naphthoate octaprenyltransferase
MNEKTREIWVRFLLYPTHTLPIAAAPVAIGVGLAIRDHVLAPVPALLAFIASWCVHVGGIFMDNYRLIADHRAVREHPELTDAVADGSLRLSAVWWATVAWFVLGAMIGSFLLPRVGIVAPVLGVLGAWASLGYSVGRWSWTRVGIADVVFFLMFGVVAVVGTYYVQAAPSYGAAAWRALPLTVFVVGLPVGALITNTMLIDDICDVEFDRRKAWRTTPVVHGIFWTRCEFSVLIAFAYGIPLWFWRGLHLGPWTLLPWLTLPFALWLTRVVCTRTSPQELEPMTSRTAMLTLVYGLLLAIGISLG